MCPEQESFTIDPGLEALLARLDTISRHPMFQAQRDRAIGLVLRPYTDDSGHAGSATATADILQVTK